MNPADHPDATNANPFETNASEETPPEATVLQEELNNWKDKAYRLAAEMENLKKRTAQDIDNTRNYAVQSFAKDLLPVADNLTRALQAPEGQEKALREGVAMVAAALQQTFARHGIEAVTTEAGQPLNPEHHQVMMQVESEHPTGAIVGEMQPGFTLNGRLLRPAFVTVSTGQKSS